MKITPKLIFAFLVFIGLVQFELKAQPCNCNGNVPCATDALILKDLINNYPANPVPPTVIYVCGTINLGELSPLEFPLDIREGFVLQGDYDFVEGTRIVFPYRYKDGLTCATQQRVINGAVVEQSLPADPDEAIDYLLTHVNPEVAFVFKMQEGCDFNGICLQGPKTDIVEQAMYAKLSPLLDHNSPCFSSINAYKEKEGLSAGLLLRGNNCNVTNSEVYGFSIFNILIKPETESTTSITKKNINNTSIIRRQ